MAKTYNNLYQRIYSLENLVLAWQKARKGKTKKPDVIEFEKDLQENLLTLQEELKNETYSPKLLKSFILRDPKTRKISKSAFGDRVIHHALVDVTEPIFDKGFIYDSCANRKGKGNLFAIERLEKFMRKVSRNGQTKGWFNSNQINGYYLKADIKHYFEEVDHEILINILMRKIKARDGVSPESQNEKVIWLVKQILLCNIPSIRRRGGGERGICITKRNASWKSNFSVFR